MIQTGDDIQRGVRLHAELVVIGAGPAGIVCAIEAAERGIDVLLIETGNRKQNPQYQALSVAHRRHPDLHAPLDIAISRQLGGTSTMWGGRCVPYDRVDFVERKITRGSVWPVSYGDVHPYFARTCEWMACGRPSFSVDELDHLPRQMIPDLDDGSVLTTSLERWSLPTDFGKVYADRLAGQQNLRVLTDTTCVRIVVDDTDGVASHVECKTLRGTTFEVAADNVILANGGLEATRLLMCSPRGDGRSIGDHSSHLGSWYMAHLEGVIADLVLETPRGKTIYDYERDTDGSYVRRRFTFAENYQLEHELPNIAGWIANPELADAGHHNARLSMTFLVLISPLGFLLAPKAQRLSLTGTKIPGAPYGMAHRSPVWAHVRNMLRHPADLMRFIFAFGIKRVFSPGRKPPGFFVANPANRYPFQYHAEHLPHYGSCVRLSEDVDELGMPRLDVDIKFSDTDVDGVLAAHEHWDDFLRTNGVGRLEYLSDDHAAAVRARLGGGFHQVGTTRMSHDPDDGVVDENLAVHGCPNVHVASSSTFVTSGQANSTFMVIVFALRLIDHLYGDAGSGDSQVGGR